MFVCLYGYMRGLERFWFKRHFECNPHFCDSLDDVMYDEVDPLFYCIFPTFYL